MSEFITKIIINETAGIPRLNEPVTVGIPFPKGVLQAGDPLGLVDPEIGPVPVQTQTLANWPDGSRKWVLFDFQVSIAPNATKEMEVRQGPAREGAAISVTDTAGSLAVDTGAYIFHLDRRAFKPFGRVVLGETDILDGVKSGTALTDEAGVEYNPIVERLFVETPGCMRTTIKAEGVFGAGKKGRARFFARLHFYAGSSLVRVEFTIHNPRAAKHPGGLWDLGDPASIFFTDLSLHLSLFESSSRSRISCALSDDLPSSCSPDSPSADDRGLPVPPSLFDAGDSRSLVIYQDSSGGDNWRSSNHVNRNGQVRTSFRGYRLYADDVIVRSGNRANPVVSVSDGTAQITAAVQYFWQNFPKALKAADGGVTVSLYPKAFDDVFELQGGERKTHTIFLDFASARRGDIPLTWVQNPLVPHAAPEWYEQSGVFPYLVAEDKDPNKELIALIHSAIAGDNTLSWRREIIDEYGWRHFGELYADHEAVIHNRNKTEDPEPPPDVQGTQQPLVSHYNNQYDCIYGMLLQFARSGNPGWFLLADQLCSHARDIDIYHTDGDRPEFNHGLFWHTEHYLDARTATHRCFSRQHASERNLASYGGGPALSHNYSTGFLYHHYLTGSPCSAEAVQELSSFVQNNIGMETTVGRKVIKGLKRLRSVFNRGADSYGFANLGKVYELDGPGRASGNSLNTLVDSYTLSGDAEYLTTAEYLISQCVGPHDDVAGRNLLDIENRWMYTVFLQSLAKYLDVKAEHGLYDGMYEYARTTFTNYVKWMDENESPYLDKPEVLEFPNETWAAQDMRKCDIFLHASQWCGNDAYSGCLDKAAFFYDKSLSYLFRFHTCNLTRPIALMMAYGTMYGWWKANGNAPARQTAMHLTRDMAKKARSANRGGGPTGLSLAKELQYAKWHILPLLLGK